MWKIIILVVVWLLISWNAAKVFEEIAEKKGHDESKYLWWCFLCGFVGYAMVIALPDRASSKQHPW